ncbi:hypothetical protein DCC81_03900 [Chitinophaga parva]|uniref:Uncharacterized protein n=1 Tax=Chitinophaga parva TaxID=2169414 RepID=A0A2T7BLS8_9BACT|nr:hypothetical protein [Chitinophaga parva]PUZ28637.1 hypothetical protein DCC81_03900 [Chitinophaga parva]
MEIVSIRKWLSNGAGPKINPYAADLSRRRSRPFTAADIIGTIEAKLLTGRPRIKKLGDDFFANDTGIFHQYIFGIARPRSDGGIEQYVVQMVSKLRQLLTEPVFFPFVFEGYQQRQLKKVLSELADHYRARLEVGKMARRVGMNERLTSQRFFLMVTALPIMIVNPISV